MLPIGGEPQDAEVLDIDGRARLVVRTEDGACLPCPAARSALYHEAKMLVYKGIFAKPSMMQLRKAQDSEAVKICIADFPAIIIP